jgi:CHAT domain-containing protein
VGDPVFAADDPRVHRDPNAPARAADAPHPASDDPISRSALIAGGARGFPRLPFSRDEVKAIAALLPDTDVMKATDFAANRPLATDGALDRYRILHIATHGLLNTAHPELSGLVLSLVDENGRPQDGFLRLQDIYNLRLSADIAVLSACRTALGRQIEGEGLVGLTRGFMYAGVPRVVASLWQVDDSATSELMREFYREIFKEGLRPAAALRAAQRKIAAEPRWAAPFFWAGFTLEGEWR